MIDCEEEASLAKKQKCMMGRYGINKSACIVALGIFSLVLLLINNLLTMTASQEVHVDKVSNNVDHEDLSYGIIIDAGSTGSRLFMYCWKSKSNQELIDIRAVNDRMAAAEYIRPLLDYAGDFISPEKHPLTPIFIFATAGMRLLNLEKQNGIIKSLQQKLPSLTKFQVLPQHIQVISGKWEGLYSWAAVNYMLGRFRFPDLETLPTEKKSLEGESSTKRQLDRPPTAGMIDMGGQLVNLGCRDEDPRFLYQIFVTTFLGFGVNEGQKKYERILEQKLPPTQADVSTNASSINLVSDGCLPVSFIKLVTKEDGNQFVRKGNGDWDSCVDNIAKLLFNEYWFSVDDILSLGGVYNHDEFEKKAKAFCSQRWPTIRKKAKAKEYPKANEERLETQCFKSAWIHAILHNGFHVDERQHHFQSAFKIKGEEVQWALGAMIYQMRYFPLLETQRQELAIRRLNNHFTDGSTGWTFFYVLAILVLLFVLYSSLYNGSSSKKYVSGRNGRGMRRDNSIWGYMMLSQGEQDYSSGNFDMNFIVQACNPDNQQTKGNTSNTHAIIGAFSVLTSSKTCIIQSFVIGAQTQVAIHMVNLELKSGELAYFSVEGGIKGAERNKEEKPGCFI
uniref:Uncharacterized protein n=1 Tax=Ditylenchus dipsaci TaxID=166011 RepID=A0A915CYQ5_9BILA